MNIRFNEFELVLIYHNEGPKLKLLCYNDSKKLTC